MPVMGLFCACCSVHCGIITHIDNKQIKVKDYMSRKEKVIMRDTTRGVAPCAPYVYVGDTLFILSSQYNRDTLCVGNKTRMIANYETIKARQIADSIKLVEQKEQQKRLQQISTDRIEVER